MRAWLGALLVLAVAALAGGLLVTHGQVDGLRGQVRQDRAVYVQQERSDRQALRGLGREIGGIVRREVAAEMRQSGAERR